MCMDKFVAGSLAYHFEKWHEINASTYVTDIVQNGEHLISYLHLVGLICQTINSQVNNSSLYHRK